MKNPFAEKTIYQIYLRSFYDSNQDGIGDIPGITAKLDYIEQLGVDMIWINPFYPSPQNDNGYDISNYTDIDPRFGTMQDFELLVAESSARNIGIMIDLVLNHTSTEHDWFQKALSGDPFYRDFYYFRQGKKDGSPPTNWESKFGGSAWEKLPDSDDYYLHLFDVTQADLNWENPHVREALYDVVRFWMEKGVTGFRLDVLNLISKPDKLEDDFIGDGRRFYTDGPKIHSYLKELHAETFGQSNLITVGEMSSTTIQNSIKYSNPLEKEVSMVFHFHHLKVDYKNGEKWRLDNVRFDELKDIFHTWQVAMADGNGWDALFFNNHDQPRALGRFTSDKKEYHYKAATMLAATIHLMRGTPYIYMGEEIGMINPRFSSIEKYNDIESINHYQLLQEEGFSEKETIKIIQERSRDNSRIPMQWDSTPQAGFTKGESQYPISESKSWINVKESLKQPNSIFAFYQKLIKLRKAMPVIQNGSYQPALLNEENVIAYVREDEQHALLAIHSYSPSDKTITIPENFQNGDILVSNVARNQLTAETQLEAYETLTICITK
ncbi:putative alpha,alpha-phosphotrehalase [Listeria fleischmannii 1991]|uniref:Alpha,alpha-phosphotrehalase n=2 Tax=Listeria fleischmannii TaxID=1069827 RepID=A0A2X3HDK4_9LIST|nr:alpha,alpha-phosphotrehalase [Listeria fleischmannii]KMT60921.1 putative alpha,alpha-phosphotrehalase [Listeria fleischmannii 1991]SQC70637.1 Trehalose-6-phosphate hydrolase [Listeria fleischmannii subsp. fleischmannii]